MAPMVVAYVPFALLVGSAAASSANPLAAWLATWTIYGGAAHLAVLDVLAHGSGWVAAAPVGLLVNARLSAYAAAMAPEWRSAPLAGGRSPGRCSPTHRGRWRAARHRVPRLLPRRGADAVPRVAGAGHPRHVRRRRLATGTPVTALLPALTLGTVVVPQFRQRPVAVAAGAASVTALATASLDAGLALLACAAVGPVPV